jgi:ferredoxin
MSIKTISKDNLAALVVDLRRAGTTVIAPRQGSDGTVDYTTIEKLDDAALGQLPRRSLKALFMPATEPLFSWRQKGHDVELTEVPTSFPTQVILGAKPCDAAAVEIVDKVMSWDYQDELWFGRRAKTTIISLACDGVDDSCFCTATGLAPDTTKGADILLVPFQGGHVVQIVTDKGAAFAATHAARFTDSPAPAEPLIPAPKASAAADLAAGMPHVRTWLAAHFEDPFWAQLGLRCHGCGACASICPTCHCFDIVDEPDGVAHGVRRRNWDTCQTGRFTVHASGHNPRENQNARFRQRVMHKFSVYPQKFGETLCTGCGRCSRACPGGMDLPEVLRAVMAMAGNDAKEVAR